MGLYLLDSDAVIDYLNGIRSTVDLLKTLDDQGHVFCLCDIVIAEVVSGVHASDRNDAEERLRSFTFLESTVDIGLQAGIWRYAYARQGVILSAPDAIIAATAREYGVTLLTRNVRHFPMSEFSIEPLSPQSR
jgi:predicted nucleic acid-binding protein